MNYVNGYEADGNIGYGIEADPFELYAAYLPVMAENAQSAMKNEAFSYRKFKVGSTLLGYNAVKADVIMISGGNRKMHKKCPKYCAEMKVLDELDKVNEMLDEISEDTGIDQGKFEPVGLATVATANKKLIHGVTGCCTPTLHMCDACMNKYSSHPSVDPGRLLNTTFPENLKYLEIHTLREYQAMSETKASQRVAYKGIVRVANFRTWHEDVVEPYRTLSSSQSQYVLGRTAYPARLVQDAILGALRQFAEEPKPPVASSPKPRLVIVQS